MPIFTVDKIKNQIQLYRLKTILPQILEVPIILFIFLQ